MTLDRRRLLFLQQLFAATEEHISILLSIPKWFEMRLSVAIVQDPYISFHFLRIKTSLEGACQKYMRVYCVHKCHLSIH